MDIFNINYTAIIIFNYSVSYIELLGTFFGFISVFLATKNNIFTWYTGIINEILFFILFYQMQLYADMILQVVFLAITLQGLFNWKERKEIIKISYLTKYNLLLISISVVIFSIIIGYLMSNIHLYFPTIFIKKASFAYIDSLILVLSAYAIILLAYKKIENWYLWIIVDLICIVLFFIKGTLFLSLEYFIFLILSLLGLINWKSKLK